MTNLYIGDIYIRMYVWIIDANNNKFRLISSPVPCVILAVIHYFQDMSELETSLSKLKALQDDDKTENALLRSRIDEQSQLIMILKQRMDEAVNHARTLERTNEALQAQR